MLPREIVPFVLGAWLMGMGCRNKPEPPPRTGTSPCPATVARGTLHDALCTTVTVAENRDQPEGRRLSLHVIVVPARSGTPARSAFTVLAGGPGQSAADVAEQMLPALAGILEHRDILLVDQRGTGRSAPLNCETPPAATLAELLRIDTDEDRLRACLAGYDADLTQYTTPVAMDDLDEVRERLGYDQLDLWGGSYGTRAGLVYMRRYPERVRTAVLDGVAPPDMAMPSSFAQDAERALSLTFDACEADDGCRTTFPELRARTVAWTRGLNATPRATAIDHPRTGRRETVNLSAAAFTATLRFMLYSPSLAAMVPWTLERAMAGDFGPLVAHADMAGSVVGSVSYGMHLAVVCSEDFPRVPTPTKRPIEAPRPVFSADTLIAPYRTACALWPKNRMPDAYYGPIRADAPTLLFSGELDPVTPPRWAERTAHELPRAKSVTVPGVGHNTIGATCVAKLIAEFVRTADVESLDTTCVDDNHRPPFHLQATGGPWPEGAP